jgi:hypothetical protein
MMIILVYKVDKKDRFLTGAISAARVRVRGDQSTSPRCRKNAHLVIELSGETDDLP